MFMTIRMPTVMSRRRPSRLKLSLKYWPHVFWAAASAALVGAPLLLLSFPLLLLFDVVIGFGVGLGLMGLGL
jgi:hypothetical protein